MSADQLLLVTLDEKRCTKCKRTWPLNQYIRHSGNRGLHPWCRECRVESGRQVRLRKPEKYKLQAREYSMKNRKRIYERQARWKTLNKAKLDAYNRRRHLDEAYGITQHDYETLRDIQGGVCAICGSDKKLHVDHDHRSGVVRGLLCFNCNTGLGKFEDNERLLRAAIGYMERTAKSSLKPGGR